jgi:hypothetical protein
MFGKYLEMLKALNIGQVAVVLIILLVLGAVAFLIYRMKTYHKRHPEKAPPAEIKTRVSKDGETEAFEPTTSILGTGKLKAYAFTNGALEPTTIPNPIGNIFFADTSMPVSGACYLVKETEGKVAAYDPRGVQFKMKETPQMAYFATHWDIVREWFKTEKPWWESAPLWLCVTVLIMLFIVTLVVLG